MGDPKKTRSKIEGPGHPWQKARIMEESVLKKDYGIKNKREIYKMRSILRKYRSQARKLVAGDSAQNIKERDQLLSTTFRLGLLEKDSRVDDVLAMKIGDIMDRRLQTVLIKKGIANTIKQARQFITHKHIMIGEKVVASPSYLVSREEEKHIRLNPFSVLTQAGHSAGGKKNVKG
jgi:small subunit ribosomal protein S4